MLKRKKFILLCSNTQRLTAGMKAKDIKEVPEIIKELRRISLDTSQLAARSFIVKMKGNYGEE